MLRTVRNPTLCSFCRIILNTTCKTPAKQVTPTNYSIRSFKLFTPLRDVKKPPPETFRSKERGKTLITWKVVGLVAAVGTISVLLLKNVQKNQELVKLKQRQTIIGKAAIGGPWSLVDCDGKITSSKDFHGKWILLYFGFTHCPDICPEELEKVTAVVNDIDANPAIPNLIPIFITIDPERDSMKVIKEYLKDFSPKFQGFTGTKAQVESAAKAYRVYFSEGPRDEDNDYMVDHTIITYLVGPDGEFVAYYGQNKKYEDMVPSITKHMKDEKLLSK